MTRIAVPPRDRPLRRVLQVSAYFRMDGGGGINGGTLAAVFNLAETGQVEMTRDPPLLHPDPASPRRSSSSAMPEPATTPMFSPGCSFVDGIRCKQRLHDSAKGLTWGTRGGVRPRWIAVVTNY